MFVGSFPLAARPFVHRSLLSLTFEGYPLKGRDQKSFLLQMMSRIDFFGALELPLRNVVLILYNRPPLSEGSSSNRRCPFCRVRQRAGCGRSWTIAHTHRLQTGDGDATYMTARDTGTGVR